MNAEDEAKLAPILNSLLNDPPLSIRCVSGSINEHRVVVVFQKDPQGEICAVALSKAQLAHINQLAQEQLP